MLRRKKEMEKIDHEIMALLQKRAKLAKELGVLKKQKKKPLRDKIQEAKRIATYGRKAVKLGLSAITVAKVFKNIMDDSHKIQKEAATEEDSRGKRKSVSRKK